MTIVVRSASGEDAPSLTFDGPRIVIGRGPGSDMRLPDPSVSLRHATIRTQGSEYAIVDESSSNGTWVGGIRLHPETPRVIRTGELVRVGRVWLELVVGQRAPTPDLGLATRDLAFALVKRAMDAMGDDTVTRVRVVEGADVGSEVRLLDEGRVYVIGRSERCDLPLADEDASREHAGVTRRKGQVLLRDLDSRNGVFLGETRIEPGRDVVWRRELMARIGHMVLALETPVEVALVDLESAEDEAMGDAEVPPPPALPVAKEETPEPAPVAAPAPPPPSIRPRKARRAWTAADFLVVTLAALVIGASIAGLVWVLR